MIPITAELIHGINCDDGVADAARVSMAKQSSNFTQEENDKLMRYLHGQVHWTPFGHQRITFSLDISARDWLIFLENANLAGFAFCRVANSGKSVLLNGSLWAWKENIEVLPPNMVTEIICHIYRKYPRAAKLFWPKLANVQRCTSYFAEVVEEPKQPQLIFHSFRVKAPISLARQLVKHQIQLCWNEESRRYIVEPVELYYPELRLKADKVKQGSKNEAVDDPAITGLVAGIMETCVETYNDLLEAGIAPECARNVLPVGSVTNWIWTGSLTAWARVCRQRLDAHAQKEAQIMAKQIYRQLSEIHPEFENLL